MAGSSSARVHGHSADVVPAWALVALRRSSARPARPSARSKPSLSIGTTLLSPPLFPRQFPLFAQSHLEEDHEHGCAQTERDQRDGEHFADQSVDYRGTD